MNNSRDLLWEILLEFRKQFYLNPSGLERVSVIPGSTGFRLYLNEDPVISASEQAIVVSINKSSYPGKNVSVFYITDDLVVTTLEQGYLNEHEVEFFTAFLPYCIMPVKAFREKRAISVLHLAQSIDGRIATLNGNSKWLSNRENLEYVHRMRALCDGMLLGSQTLQKDKPALTVRYVTGPNPTKIVVGNSARNFDSILESKDRIIHLVTCPAELLTGVTQICIEKTSGYIHPTSILAELFLQGVSSVYIEGGALTASLFIKAGATDLVNFYIAPVILGSGISLGFDGILEIENAMSMKNCSYSPMGDGFMVRAQLTH